MADNFDRTYILSTERWPYVAICNEPKIIDTITERLGQEAVGMYLGSAVELMTEQNTYYDTHNHYFAFLAGASVAAEAFIHSEIADNMKLETIANLQLRCMPFFKGGNGFRESMRMLLPLIEQGHNSHPEFKPFQSEINDYFANPSVSHTLDQTSRFGAGFMLYQLDMSWESIIGKAMQKLGWEQL